MFWKLSLLTSFAAVAFAGYNIVAGTENWGPSFFAAVLMFTVATTLLAGPYVILGILAFLIRSHRALSATLFAFILLISVLGITLLSLETHAYLNRNKALPEATNLGILFCWRGSMDFRNTAFVHYAAGLSLFGQREPAV